MPGFDLPPGGERSDLGRFLSWSQNPGILMAMMGQTFINMLGVGIIGPVLPLYANSFGVSAAMVGLLISSFGLSRIPINVPVGGLAERIGRRPLLICGPLLIAVSAVLSGMATTFGQLIAFRLLQGVGSAFQMTAGMIVVADISNPQNRGRTMSTYQGALLLGTSVGPIIGGLLGEQFGYRAPFFVYGALALCAAAWAFFVVPETKALTASTRDVTPARATPESAGGTAAMGRRGAPARGAGLNLLRNPNFLLVCLVSLAIFFTRSGTQSTILPLLGSERLGIGPAKLGYAFTAIAVINFLTISVSGIVCDRYGRKTAIVPSCILCGLAVITYTFGHSYGHFMGSSLLLGLGTGVGGPAPAAYVSDLDLPGGRGLTMGVYRTVSDTGMVLGPLLLGAIADRFSYDAAIWANGVLFVCVGLAFWAFAKETHGRARAKSIAQATTG
jgi:DHA1 family multidrug resistance protein-like MFS transporter